MSLLDSYSVDELTAKLKGATPEQLDAILPVLEAELAYRNRWQPMPHQVPPADSEWLVWFILGGRGIGKTDGCASYLDDHVNGPPCDPRIPGGHRPGIIAPTLGDAIDSCVNGPSGIKAHNADVRSVQKSGGSYVYWPNGAECKLFGAHTPEDVERLRAGGNRCVVFAEEVAAWRYLAEVWQHMRYGLRIGPHPRVIASTTPKPRKFLMSLVGDQRTRVSRARTLDNPYLAQEVREQLYSDYGDSRLGRQELEGEFLTDVPGAIATMDLIATCRRHELPEISRVLVSVDPAVTNTADSDETGIAVQAKGRDGHCYLLKDLSCKVDVDEWARIAVAAAVEYGAGALIYEKNQGADAIELVLRQAMVELDVGTYELRLEPITASKSKFDRAMGLEQAIRRETWHPVGYFPSLEEQLCSWTLDSPMSPDRLDAVAHGFNKLMGHRAGGVGKSFGAQIAAGRIG